MKNSVLFIILLIPIMSQGQDSLRQQAKFYVGFNFSPNYSYRNLESDMEFQNVVNLREDEEDPSFGFNTGFAIQYFLCNKLEFELGLQYSRQTTSSKNLPFIDNVSLNQIGTGDILYRFDYLEVPFRANFRLLNKKVFVYVTGGASLNFFLDDRVKSELKYNDGSTKVEEGKTGIRNFNKIGVSYLVGLGVGYQFSEKFNLRAEPIYRMSLTPISDAPVEQFNYSIGGQFGIYMKL